MITLLSNNGWKQDNRKIGNRCTDDFKETGEDNKFCQQCRSGKLIEDEYL